MLEQLRNALIRIIEAIHEFRDNPEDGLNGDQLQDICDDAEDLLDRLAKVNAPSLADEVARLFDAVPMRPEDRLTDAHLQRIIREKVIEVLTREA